jgi:hypothetical protein
MINKVQVRVNSNVKFRFLEELVEEKKRLHINTFKYVMDQLEKQLLDLAQSEDAIIRAARDQRAWEVSCDDLVTAIMQDCLAVVSLHSSREAEDYLDDGTYRAMVEESLAVKEMGRYKFLLWLEGSETAEEIKSRGLLSCHRKWNVMQERKLRLLTGDMHVRMALELCRSNGLLRSNDLEERDVSGETPLLKAAADGIK